MSTGPKKVENRGGWRPGAGRKPDTLSKHQVDLMLRAAKKRAKEEGKTIDDILLDIIYGDETNNKDRLAGIKLFKDYTIPKIKEEGDTNKALGPQIGLPAMKEDPAKVVQMKKQA